MLETVSCGIMLFISFGVGLDPRQSQVFGPALGPILIGFALGLLTFTTGIMRTGYTGACKYSKLVTTGFCLQRASNEPGPMFWFACGNRKLAESLDTMDRPGFSAQRKCGALLGGAASPFENQGEILTSCFVYSRKAGTGSVGGVAYCFCLRGSYQF